MKNLNLIKFEIKKRIIGRNLLFRPIRFEELEFNLKQSREVSAIGRSCPLYLCKKVYNLL